MSDIITKKCTKCGLDKDIACFRKDRSARDGLCYWCKECSSINEKKWYRENTERARESRREWYLKNSEKVIIRSKEWTIKYREKSRLTKKNWEINNPEKAKASHKKWKNNNPEKVSADRQNRRAMVKGAVGSFTKEEWSELCVKHDNKCLRCGENKKLSVDHVIPLSQGGTNWISNIQPLCRNCNSIKNKKTEDYR